jgi:hypothetical protein
LLCQSQARCSLTWAVLMLWMGHLSVGGGTGSWFLFVWADALLLELSNSNASLLLPVPLVSPSPQYPLTCFLQGRLALQDNCLSFSCSSSFCVPSSAYSPLAAACAISYYSSRSAPFPPLASPGIPPQPRLTFDGSTQGRTTCISRPSLQKKCFPLVPHPFLAI